MRDVVGVLEGLRDVDEHTDAEGVRDKLCDPRALPLELTLDEGEDDIVVETVPVVDNDRLLDDDPDMEMLAVVVALRVSVTVGVSLLRARAVTEVVVLCESVTLELKLGVALDGTDAERVPLPDRDRVLLTDGDCVPLPVREAHADAEGESDTVIDEDAHCETLALPDADPVSEGDVVVLKLKLTDTVVEREEEGECDEEGEESALGEEPPLKEAINVGDLESEGEGDEETERVLTKESDDNALALDEREGVRVADAHAQLVGEREGEAVVRVVKLPVPLALDARVVETLLVRDVLPDLLGEDVDEMDTVGEREREGEGDVDGDREGESEVEGDIDGAVETLAE